MRRDTAVLDVYIKVLITFHGVELCIVQYFSVLVLQLLNESLLIKRSATFVRVICPKDLLSSYNLQYCVFLSP